MRLLGNRRLVTFSNVVTTFCFIFYGLTKPRIYKTGFAIVVDDNLDFMLCIMYVTTTYIVISIIEKLSYFKKCSYIKFYCYSSYNSRHNSPIFFKDSNEYKLTLLGRLKL